MREESQAPLRDALVDLPHRHDVAPQQLDRGLPDAAPLRSAVQIAALDLEIDRSQRIERRILAMSVDERSGGTPDILVHGHEPLPCRDAPIELASLASAPLYICNYSGHERRIQ